jgi:Flp pilus assembly protein TadB
MDGLRRRGAASMAKAYFSNKKEEIEMSMRRKFGSNSESDLEAQNPLVDEFHDETTTDAAAKRRSDHSFITRIVLIVAGCTLAINAVVVVGFSATVALLAGLFASAVSITVAVVQLKLEDMESKY